MEQLYEIGSHLSHTACISYHTALEFHELAHQPFKKEYVREFNAKKYIPELLFEDKEMVNRIKFHPMALWKTRSRRMFFCKF